MKKRAVIISNGSIGNYKYIKSKINSEDYVICSDGAITHCLAMDIMPDLWIGDFDSCRFDDLISENPMLKNIDLLRLKSEKDETDTHVACMTAVQKGLKKVTIFGGMGKRCDHMMGNFALLEYLYKSDVQAFMEDERNIVFFTDKTFTLNKQKKYISIIPADEEILIKKSFGLKYEILNLKLKRYETRGISNEFTENEAVIEIGYGSAFIVLSND